MTIQKQIKATCLMTTVFLAAQMSAFSPSASAAHFVNRKNAVASIPAETTLMRLKKADSLWTVLNDAEVKKAMAETMGTATEKYFDLTQLTDMPTVEGDEMYSTGGVRGLSTVLECFFDLNLSTKKLCVVILDDGKLDIYGAASPEQMPPASREYVKDLQARLSGIPEKLNIQFKSADTTPVKVASKPLAKKNLKLGVVTGSYSRVDADPCFENADIKVVRLPGNKIKFCCTAFNGTHSGEASGVVPIVNNIAEYDFDSKNVSGFKLSMAFDGKYLWVNQDGEGFGGIGVTAAGKYEKIDDTAPKFDAEQ